VPFPYSDIPIQKTGEIIAFVAEYLRFTSAQKEDFDTEHEHISISFWH
jgi:hypothetical protein